MTYEERKKDEAARRKLQMTLAPRLKKLAKRKVNPLQAKQFCEKYGHDESNVSRLAAVKHVSRWESINPIDRDLSAEGV